MDEIRIRTIKEWEDQGILDMIMDPGMDGDMGMHPDQQQMMQQE